MNDTLLDDAIPSKFKNPETGEVQIGAMAQSYKELEKKMSKMPSVPKTAEEYCVNCDHGLFDIDVEMNKKLHEKGFTNEQVQTVYDLAVEKMVPMVVEMAGEFQAEREVEKLVEHFGGPEQWQEMSRQLLSFGQKELPADVLDSLSSSYEGVIALYNMMQGQEPVVSVSPEEKKSDDMDLKAMMRDPRYWRDKDPSFVSKVTEGFQRLYKG